MRIFLTGFMGSGKTTVGRLLSERLEVPFVDLDTEIEREAGMSIREIFERGGEALFRRLEQAALVKAVAVPGAVVATGGGTLTVERNLELLADTGVSVWLDPPFSLIVERVGILGKEDRPLFQTEAQALELYRRLEQAALVKAVAVPGAVVATGGGTLTVERNLELLADTGVSVWLDPPFSLIVERVGILGKEDRPLFQTEAQALELYRHRLPVYRRADFRLAVEPGETPEEVAARVASLLLEGGS